MLKGGGRDTEWFEAWDTSLSESTDRLLSLPMILELFVGGNEGTGRDDVITATGLEEM